MALICFCAVMKENHQSVLAIPLFQSFIGEYSQAGGDWSPLDENTEISAYDGDVILRGHFEYDIPEGTRLNFYLDHIGYRISVNGSCYMMNAVMEVGLNSSVCGRLWGSFLSPGITTADEIEIELHNPHTFGNKNAFRYFLSTMCNTPNSSELLEKYIEPYCMPLKISGTVLLILALFLLGASVASLVLKYRIGERLGKIGMLVLFAGMYFFLDTLDCFYERMPVAVRTYGSQICMMFFALWLGFCLLDILEGKAKRIAGAAVVLSVFADMAFLVCSFTGVTVIYDTAFYWCVLQVFLCVLYLITGLCVFSRFPWNRRMPLAACMLLCISMLLDFAGVAKTIYSRGTCTKAVFMCLTLCGIIWLVKSIIINHQSSVRMKTMEKELEESRISIMLSQIQPHFLYNTLNTIYHLCEKDAEVAQQAISDFSDYLQMNLKSLNRKCAIPFSKELKHVKTYLSLEKLRFAEELEVRYEIETLSFWVPALTEQP